MTCAFAVVFSGIIHTPAQRLILAHVHCKSPPQIRALGPVSSSSSSRSNLLSPGGFPPLRAPPPQVSHPLWAICKRELLRLSFQPPPFPLYQGRGELSTIPDAAPSALSFYDQQLFLCSPVTSPLWSGFSSVTTAVLSKVTHLLS